MSPHTTSSTTAASFAAPVWAVFGDLMAGLLGAFVLILVCALGMQLDLAERLKAEVQQRQAEAQRREGAGAGAGRPAGRRPRDAGGRPHRHQRQRAVCLQLGRSAARWPAAAEEPGRPLAAYLASRDER
jgi:hypothetical protein